MLGGMEQWPGKGLRWKSGAPSHFNLLVWTSGKQGRRHQGRLLTKYRQNSVSPGKQSQTIAVP